MKKCVNCGDTRPGLRNLKQGVFICQSCGKPRFRSLEKPKQKYPELHDPIRGHRYVFEEQPSEML